MMIHLAEEAVQTLKGWIDDGDGGTNEITLFLENGHSGYGLYVALSEYPGEGAAFLAPAGE